MKWSHTESNKVRKFLPVVIRDFDSIAGVGIEGIDSFGVLLVLVLIVLEYC